MLRDLELPVVFLMKANNFVADGNPVIFTTLLNEMVVDLSEICDRKSNIGTSHKFCSFVAAFR